MFLKRQLVSLLSKVLQPVSSTGLTQAFKPWKLYESSAFHDHQCLMLTPYVASSWPAARAVNDPRSVGSPSGSPATTPASRAFPAWGTVPGASPRHERCHLADLWSTGQLLLACTVAKGTRPYTGFLVRPCAQCSCAQRPCKCIRFAVLCSLPAWSPYTPTTGLPASHPCCGDWFIRGQVH